MVTTTKVLLKFADDDNFYKCEVQRMSEHMIKVIGLIQDLSGFQIFSEAKTMIGDYSKYTYEYANPNLDENTYEYTDNGAVYPDEGSDKSQKEQIKDELEVYADSLITKAKKSINDTVSNIESELKADIEDMDLATGSQITELQDTLLELYEAIDTLTELLNETLSTTDDTTTK